MAYQFPFSSLCPPGNPNITLTYSDRDEDDHDYFMAPGQTSTNPLYSFSLSGRNKQGQYNALVRNHAHGSPREVCKVEMFPDNNAEMSFPWMKWSCQFRIEDDSDNIPVWLSDTGVLEGHGFEWQFMNWYRDGFVIRQFDTEDSYNPIGGVILPTWGSGKMEFPVHLIQNEQQLDEFVVVAWTAMQQQRQISAWKFEQQYGQTWAKPPWGKPVSRSSSSSSSSSSSAGSSKAKKKGGKKKLFGKLGL